MITALLIGLLLMIIGTVMGCLCGMIREVPRAVLLSFAVIFVYILALSVGMAEAGAMFVTSIPFIEQINGFNAIVQQMGNVNDWAGIYRVLSEQFLSMAFVDEAIKLWIFSFEVSLVHTILFPKKHYSWWYDWFIWYLKECLAIGLLMILNALIVKAVGAVVPELIVTWLPRILMGFLVITIILCAVKLVLKFTFPLLDVFISFFTDNGIGRLMISSVTTTGVLILVAFGCMIFKVRIPGGALAAVTVAPIGVAFFLVWYILYVLIGYRKR